MVAAFIDFGKTIVLYFLVVNIVNSERRFKIVITLLIILTTLLAIHGIYQHNTGLGWAGQTMDKDGRIKWIGIFNDSNDLALALIIIVPFC